MMWKISDISRYLSDGTKAVILSSEHYMGEFRIILISSRMTEFECLMTPQIT